MIELTTKPQGADNAVKTTALFSIDGVEYSVPSKPRPNLTLKYLYAVKSGSVELAAAQLLEDMLGVEGYAALMKFDDLDGSEFKRIMTDAGKIAMGELEQSLENS